MTLIRFRTTNQRLLLDKTCAFVLHLDIGIESRNRNAIRSHKIFQREGVEILTSEVKYYEDITTAVTSCKQELEIETISSLVRGFYRFPQTGGQIGIYHSFVNTIMDFLHSNKEYLIILEDDFRMSDKFIKNLSTFMFFSKNLERDLTKLFTAPIDTRYFVRKSFEGASLKTFARDCTAALFLPKATAQIIIEDLKQFGIRVPLDWYLFNSREIGDPGLPIDSYEVNPFFVPFGKFIPEAKQSTITNS
jgi:GR25 family glycosyltransferase involved in LPS biosynthesis